MEENIDTEGLLLFVRFCYPHARLFKEGDDYTEGVFSRFLSTGEGKDEVLVHVKKFSFWKSYLLLVDKMKVQVFDKESIFSFFLGTQSLELSGEKLPLCYLSLVFKHYLKSKSFEYFDAERMSFGKVVSKLPHYLLVETPVLEIGKELKFGAMETKTLVYHSSLSIDEGDLVCFVYGYAICSITSDQEKVIREMYAMCSLE